MFISDFLTTNFLSELDRFVKQRKIFLNTKRPSFCICLFQDILPTFREIFPSGTLRPYKLTVWLILIATLILSGEKARPF